MVARAILFAGKNKVARSNARDLICRAKFARPRATLFAGQIRSLDHARPYFPGFDFCYKRRAIRPHATLFAGQIRSLNHARPYFLGFDFCYKRRAISTGPARGVTDTHTHTHTILLTVLIPIPSETDLHYGDTCRGHPSSVRGRNRAGWFRRGAVSLSLLHHRIRLHY